MVKAEGVLFRDLVCDGWVPSRVELRVALPEELRGASPGAVRDLELEVHARVREVHARRELALRQRVLADVRARSLPRAAALDRGFTQSLSREPAKTGKGGPFVREKEKREEGPRGSLQNTREISRKIHPHIFRPSFAGARRSRAATSTCAPGGAWSRVSGVSSRERELRRVLGSRRDV